MGSRHRWGYGIEIGPDRVQTCAVAVNADGALETQLGRSGPVAQPTEDGEPLTSHARFEAQAEEVARQLGELRHNDGGRGLVHLAVWDTAWEARPDRSGPSAAPLPGEMARALARHLDEAGITIDVATTSTAAVQRLGPVDAEVLVWTGADLATVVHRRCGEVVGVRSQPRETLPPAWRRGGVGRCAEGAIGDLTGSGSLERVAPYDDIMFDDRPVGISAAPGATRPPLPLAALGAAASAAVAPIEQLGVVAQGPLTSEPTDAPLRAWGVRHMGATPAVAEDRASRRPSRLLVGAALGGGVGCIAVAAVAWSGPW
ncbi:MAG: hypothetical protein AAGD35_07210 [Actinomycetota bacterium]